jgi:hypothetical protein
MEMKEEVAEMGYWRVELEKVMVLSSSRSMYGNDSPSSSSLSSSLSESHPPDPSISSHMSLGIPSQWSMNECTAVSKMVAAVLFGE